MTAAAADCSFPGLRQSARRIALALALSVMAHLALVESLTPDVPLRPGFQGALTVRIVPVAEGAAAVPIAAAESPVERDEMRNVERSGRKEWAKLALSQAPDPIYYSARDLDFYPRPAEPLELREIEGRVATSFRFDLLIDERGVVTRISGEGEPLPLKEELQAVLAVTRFLPGRKDGRAVRSRVTLSIEPGSPRDARGGR